MINEREVTFKPSAISGNEDVFLDLLAEDIADKIIADRHINCSSNPLPIPCTETGDD